MEKTTSSDRQPLPPAFFIAAAILILLPFFAFAAGRLLEPGDGTQIVLDFARAGAKGLAISPLTARSEGLADGDVVLDLGDQPVEDLLSQALAGQLGRSRARSGEVLPYTVERGGISESVLVPLARYPLGQALLDKWGMYLFLTYLELVSLFVFLRRPRLPAAQLFLLLGNMTFANGMTFNLGLQVSDLLSGWKVAVWLFESVVMDGVILAALLHLSLTFPDRRSTPDQRRWLIGLAYLGVWIVYGAFVATRWPAALSYASRFLLLLQGTTVVPVVYFALVLLSWALSYRWSASVVARRQTGWILWGMTIALLPFIALSLVPSALGLGVPLGANFGLIGLCLCAIPTTCTIAILRERLFDIDTIINRTLVYGLLTATLAMIYAGSIFLLQQLFRALTGQASSLGVVASTLVIAALFNPLRHRLNASVDRRFYRQKYDAAQTLATFAAAARDELDLARLTEQLVEVVDETMRPGHVSFWLRGSEAQSPTRGASRNA